MRRTRLVECRVLRNSSNCCRSLVLDRSCPEFESECGHDAN